MNWLWQNLFTSFIWELLLICGGAALLGFLKRRLPEKAPIMAYAFFGATCVAIIIFTFTGRGIMAKRQQDITPENLQENLRKWADDLGLGTTKMPDAQENYFGLVVRVTNGNQIMVFRAKDRANFLQFQSPLMLSQEHLAILSKLTMGQADEAIEEITLEMNRQRIGYVMQTSTAPSGFAPQIATTKPLILQETITVIKAVAISNDLNEGYFNNTINEMDAEIGTIRLITDLTLKRYNREATSSPKSRRQ